MNLLQLTADQQRAYDRFIRARNTVGIVRTKGFASRPWVRLADVVCTVDTDGLGHPLFEPNDVWLEYKEASLAWWAIEPEFRKTERLSAVRGDYGASDSWETKQSSVTTIVEKFRE